MRLISIKNQHKDSITEEHSSKANGSINLFSYANVIRRNISAVMTLSIVVVGGNEIDLKIRRALKIKRIKLMDYCFLTFKLKFLKQPVILSRKNRPSFDRNRDVSQMSLLPKQLSYSLPLAAARILYEFIARPCYTPTMRIMCYARTKSSDIALKWGYRKRAARTGKDTHSTIV
ncbi:hypothetical protein DICVIV_11238 [Dictyocaulus viviparus]|uniref:Uncharacterized protein n=1 Tax=Dictyocaulus viviparus TaxID=29172 RepID=A0A0D8XDT8_DICVI|nr:hypothetical protein DICVIV_11238 [Dictyocaulus viviparus]